MKRNTLRLILFAVLVLLLAACGGPAEPTASVYGDLLAENNITLEDQQKLAEFSYAVLDHYFDPEGEEADMARTAFQNFDYDMIFITYLNNGSLRCSYGGNANSLTNRMYADLMDANLDCIEDERFGGVIAPEETEDIEIVINFLLNRRRLTHFGLNDLENKIELGVHAIEIEAGGQTAYFKESVPISHNYDLETTLQRLCLKADQDEDCYTDVGTKLFIYDTLTFKVNRALEVTDLYRYNVYVDITTIDQNRLLQSLEWAEQWFDNNTNPETGLLEYTYYPSDDAYADDNNYVRQLACLWAMSDLQDFLGNNDLDEVVTTSLDHYLQNLTVGGYIAIHGDSKLPYNAFPLMALLSMEDYPNRDEIMQTLADAIVAQQNEDGSYKTSFVSDQLSGVDFYPGEAMLSLMKYYNYTEDEKYLDSVYKAFDYYREYWRGNKNTAFIPWHSQTYLLLYRAVEDPEIAEFVFEMNDWLIQNYQLLRTEYPDLHGGFPASFPRNSTSAYMEGMNDAYTLAVLVGDQEHQDIYSQTISYAVRFILQMQYTPDGVFYLSNPDRVVGGFRHSLVINDQRNDYTQHASFALMKVYDNGLFDD